MGVLLSDYCHLLLRPHQPQLNSSGYCFCQWTKNKCKNLLPRNALHAQISTDA